MGGFSDSSGNSQAWDLYLRDIRDSRILAPEEEKAVLIRCLQGCPSARKSLILHNLRFVLRVAMRYRFTGIPLADMMSEGNLGLIRAVETFDPTRNVRFLSYAVWWVRAYILRFVMDTGAPVRIPRDHWKRDGEGFARTESLGIDVMEACLLRREGAVPNPDPIDEIPAVVAKILTSLPSREAEILIRIYGLNHGPPMSLREIAAQFDISGQRVRQLRDQALARIRRNSLCMELVTGFR